MDFKSFSFNRIETLGIFNNFLLFLELIMSLVWTYINVIFRETENVIVSPSGSLLRLKSAILEFSLLDTSLHLDERSVPLQNLRRTVRNKTGHEQVNEDNERVYFRN